MARNRELKKSKGLHWKYHLRLAIVPFLARVGRFFGISWETLGDKLGREVLIAQTRSQWPTRVIEPAEEPLDVVFLTMMGGNQALVSTEVVLGRILQARGHRVRYVLCDEMLPACEVKWEGQEHRWQEACAKCYEFGKRYLCGARYEVLPVSELIADQTDSTRWDEYVESALLKHYHVGVLCEDPEVVDRRKRFAEAAAVSAKVGGKITEMKPDRVIMSHGIYCTWGPAREVLVAAGIPVMTYGEGKKVRTMKFNWDVSADWWDFSVEWERVKNTPLTDRQEKAIDSYLASRRTHVLDARVYNFGEEESLAQTRKRLHLDADKQTFVLFTNVLWDAASAQREIAFKNPIEWVMETIAWFAQHPKKQLVVKIHPAEVVIGTSQPFVSVIAGRFPDLPANVRVIEPQEKVNSWSIMQVADLGLVHTSTVGMELPLEGIPSMVVSRTHFRGRGFTIDVSSREEYFDVIENWDGSEVDRDELKVVAKRYAHIMFQRYQLPFPFLHEYVVNDTRALVNIAEQDTLSRPAVRVFLDGFKNRHEFLLP